MLLAAVDKRDKYRFFGKPVTDDQVGSCLQAGSVLGVECLLWSVQMAFGPVQFPFIRLTETRSGNICTFCHLPGKLCCYLP